MFTAQGNRLNSHYNDDLRFCRVEGVVNHYQRLKDAEQLQALYAARDAALGVERVAIEAAIPVLQNYMMIRSSVIMKHTTVVSQLVELSHDDIPGVFYFTGGGMAKSPQLPSDAYWVGNRFNLGHISLKLCRVMIWYKNTDEALFYKDFGFAYLTSNHPEAPGAGKHNMLNDFGYASEIFEYHYETEVFKKLRGNWDLSFLQQPLNTHYRLIKEAYDARHLTAPSNYESNNTLLFDGQNMRVYPGQHPNATCAQYFDLSRVDPDARGITIYFFPGHEKVLYQDHGFAYIVSGAAKMPGTTRAEMIAKFHNPIFATYYTHQVWRTYDITYPKRWRLEMDQVEYDWSIEKARQDAKHKKHMAMVKGVVGIGLGAFASTLVPGLGSQLLTAILRGAAFGGVSSTVQGGNIAKGTFQGALFAGLNHTMSSMSVLKDAKKLQDALRIGVTAAISAELNGDNVFKSMLIAVGTDALVGQFMKSEGLTKQEALIRAFGTSAVAGVLGGQNLGNALMAGAIGAMGKIAEQAGEELGNGIKEELVENRVQKKDLQTEEPVEERPIVKEQPMILGEVGNNNAPKNDGPTNGHLQRERLEEIQEFFGVRPRDRDVAGMTDDILTGRYLVMGAEMMDTHEPKETMLVRAKKQVDGFFEESHRLMDEAYARREEVYKQHPQLRQYDRQYKEGMQRFKYVIPQDSTDLGIRALVLVPLIQGGKVVDRGKKLLQFSRSVNRAVGSFYKHEPFSEVELVGQSLQKTSQGMLRMWDGYRNEPLPNSSVDALRLNQQLALSEQRAMFTPSGGLSRAAIESSRPFPLILKNKALLKELSERPGKLSDWMKYETQPIHTESGLARMHFYKNPITNDIFYDMDYKAVFDHNGFWKLEVAPKFEYQPPQFIK